MHLVEKRISSPKLLFSIIYILLVPNLLYAQLPDLRISTNTSGNYASGQTIQVQVTVTRTQGSLTNGVYVDAHLFWSINSTWDKVIDKRLWRSNNNLNSPDFPNTYLNSFGSKTVTATLTLPNVTDGNYYIIAVVDSSDFHPETNNGNNTQSNFVSVSNPVSIGINQNLIISPTKSLLNSYIYSLPNLSEYSNIEPYKDEKNIVGKFRIINNGNSTVSISNWGIWVTGGQQTNFRIEKKSGLTLSPGQSSSQFDVRGYITDNQLLGGSTTNFSGKVQVEINGSWMDVNGTGSSSGFTVRPRPALTNGMLIKRPRNKDSSDPEQAKIYYHQNGRKWQGLETGLNNLFPNWKNEYYVYPISTVQGLSTPSTPNTNQTEPVITGRNLLYKDGIDVYILEPEPGTSSPLKSRLFADENAFFSYGYNQPTLDTEPIPLNSSQLNWIRGQYPIGTQISSGVELLTPSPNQIVTTDEIRFSWTDMGASYYELYVDNNAGLGSAEISPEQIKELQGYSQTEYTISGNWLPQNQYSWKIIAVMPSGNKIESDVLTFKYMPPTVSEPVWQPLYRLYHSTDKDHFYCSSDAHRQVAIDAGFKDERVEGFVSIKRFNAPDLVNIFRFYDGSKKTHYYTVNEEDKDEQIITGLTYEGIVGYAYGTAHDELMRLYYLKNSSNYDNFYTTSHFERDNAIDVFGFQQVNSFQAYVSPAGDQSSVPLNESQLLAGKGVNTQNGNFTYYTKTSFNMPDIGKPLVFAHVYNSANVSLAADITPLGAGWTHSYNIYMIDYGKVFAFFWPDGSIYFYDSSTYEPITLGVYDYLNSTGGNHYIIQKKDQTKYHFEHLPGTSNDSPYMLQKIEDKNGNTITCTYETSGLKRLTTVTGTTGRTLTFNYYSAEDRQHLISSVRENALGRSIDFTYDDIRNLKTYKNPDGRTTEYFYDETRKQDHQLTRIQLPNGNYIDNTYENRKIKSQSWKGSTSELRLSIAPDKNRVTDEEGRIKDFYYNTNLFIQKIVDVSGTGNVELWYADNKNPSKPTKTKDKNGNITDYTYDNRGNITQIRQPEGVTHNFAYNIQNNLTKYTDPRTNATNLTYDSNGNLISISDPLSHSTNLSRRSNGLIESITNPNGHIWNFGYDQFGNVTSIRDPLSYTTNMSYDNASRMKQLRNAKNQTTTYIYTNNDLIKNVTDAANSATDYGYDGNDNLTSITDPKGQTTQWSYDNQDLLASITNPNGDRKSFAYYDDGAISNRTNPDGGQTSYNYNQSGRLSNINSSSINATLGYDANGNITSVSDNNGSMSFGYDGLNRLTNYRDFYNNSINYGYDRSGNVISINYRSGKTVTYAYHADNRLKSVTDWNSKKTTYTYYPDGNIQRVTYPNGCYTTFEYDAAERLTKLYNRKSNGEIIASYEYELDALGNHVRQTFTEPLSIPTYLPKNISLNYDAANRITSDGTYSYSFSRNGNQIGKSGLANYSYVYDSENRLTNISGASSVSYVYDVFGNRRQAARNGATARYVLDINGAMSHVLIETDTNNNPTAYYIYGLGLLYRIKSDGTYQFYHYNNVGSTVAITDQNQNITHKYTYDPFGEVMASEEADFNPFRFVGQFGVMDEGNDLFYMRARYYDQKVGRFLSEDEIWDTNLYFYANGNPLMNIDPNGAFAKEVIGFLYGAGEIVIQSKPVADWAGNIVYNYLGGDDYYYNEESDKILGRVQTSADIISKGSNIAFNSVSLKASYRDYARAWAARGYISEKLFKKAAFGLAKESLFFPVNIYSIFDKNASTSKRWALVIIGALPL